MGSPVPEFRDQKSIRLLRDVDEHWEQVENGRSLAEARVTRPDEGPGRIEYNNKHIWIGGFNTLEIFSGRMRSTRRCVSRPKPTSSVAGSRSIA